MNEPLTCTNCHIELTTDMEVEYSQEVNATFCDPKCATNYYYDYMRSTPLAFDLEDDMKAKNIKIENGKLYSAK